jgi:sugar phosphate isomerase/epimerase
VRALRDHGYAGPMMIELCQDESEDYDTSNARFVADTKFSLAFMRAVFDRVDDAARVA